MHHLTTFPNASANSLPGTQGSRHKLGKRRKRFCIRSILHNWWRIWALEFHQEVTKDPIEQTETIENLTDISGLVLYQTLFYLFEKITTSFGYNTTIQHPNHYFNVSRNIIKQTQHLVIKVPVIAKQTVNRK